MEDKLEWASLLNAHPGLFEPPGTCPLCLTPEGPSPTFLLAPPYSDFNTEPEQLLLRDPKHALPRARAAAVFRSEWRQGPTSLSVCLVRHPLCPSTLDRGWLSDLLGECLGE